MIQVIGDFLGTFLICFVYLTTHNFLAIGIAMSLAYFLIKGSFNPAISLARYMTKEFSTYDLILALMAEFLGVIAAVTASKIVFSSRYK